MPCREAPVRTGHSVCTVEKHPIAKHPIEKCLSEKRTGEGRRAAAPLATKRKSAPRDPGVFLG